MLLSISGTGKKRIPAPTKNSAVACLLPLQPSNDANPTLTPFTNARDAHFWLALHTLERSRQDGCMLVTCFAYHFFTARTDRYRGKHGIRLRTSGLMKDPKHD